MDSLTELLHKIQNQYFPRWDIAHKYRIERWDLAGARCNWHEKLIQVSDVNDILVIIHEICHAVTLSGRHGPKWQNRFLKAADVANTSGNLELAEAIKLEVKRYQEQFKNCPEERITAEFIRSEINDAALEVPNVSFEDVIKWVARENCMLPEELVKYYPKSARRAFDQAHRDIEVGKLAREKYGIK